MPGRVSTGADNYRYGFNGKENDNEVKGNGNQQDYGMRIYDPRLGKFLSVDPLIGKFPYYSPYHFAGNKPIVALDLDGLEDIWFHEKTRESDGVKIIIQISNDESNFEENRKMLASSMGLDVSSLPSSGFFHTTSTQKDLGAPEENIRFSYTPAVVVIPQKTFGEKAADYGISLDARYIGTKGLKNLGSDVSDLGNLTKLAGAATTVLFGPEVGLPLIRLGETIDLVGTAAEIHADVNEGRAGEAILRAGVTILTGTIAPKVNASTVMDEAQKVGVNVGVDKVANDTRDIIIENIYPKKK